MTCKDTPLLRQVHLTGAGRGHLFWEVWLSYNTASEAILLGLILACKKAQHLPLVYPTKGGHHPLHTSVCQALCLYAQLTQHNTYATLFCTHTSH